MDQTPVTVRKGTTKRKADDDTAVKKADTKKSRPTFTPAAANKALKRTTPARNRAATAMAEADGQDEMGPAAKKQMEVWFKELGKSLSNTITGKISEDFKQTFTIVGEKVAKNERAISDINKAIQKIEKQGAAVEQRISSLFEDNHREGPSIAAADDILQVDMRVREENRSRSDNFDKARRSLRLWPVPGDDGDLLSEVVRFIRTKLRVQENECDSNDIERVRRTKAPKRSSVNHEVSVVFLTKTVRDNVSAHGKDLACFKDNDGWPTAGLRIEYPAHLAMDFRTLEWYGREMRLKHGRGTRRNIKFDDEEEMLYIDVCLPDTDFWHRITPLEAKKFKSEVTDKRAATSRRLLERPFRDENPNFEPLGRQRGSVQGVLRSRVEEGSPLSEQRPSASGRSWGGDRNQSKPYVSPRAAR